MSIVSQRYGKYKAHFATQGSMQCGPNNTDTSCRPTADYTVLAQPAVYNLELDPSEEYALEVGTSEYEEGLAGATEFAQKHRESVSDATQAITVDRLDVIHGFIFERLLLMDRQDTPIPLDWPSLTDCLW